MDVLVWLGIITTVVGLGCMLAGSYAGRWWGDVVFKPMASTGFLLTGLGAGVLDSTYGLAVGVALVFGWIGDVFLIPKNSKRLLLAGIAAFLVGHLGFVVAFFIAGVQWSWSVAMVVPVVLVGFVVWRWLSKHVSSDLVPAVIAYIVVISVMLVISVGTAVALNTPYVAIGASMFFASDLSVARHRFVKRDIVNRLWGSPLYFGAQTLLALTVSARWLG